jgi:hypothetical protein
MLKHTPGPWAWREIGGAVRLFGEHGRRPMVLTSSAPLQTIQDDGLLKTITPDHPNAKLISKAPELLERLHDGRRAIGEHTAPGDCYATGPLTGDLVRDLVECPACIFIKAYDQLVEELGVENWMEVPT